MKNFQAKCILLTSRYDPKSGTILGESQLASNETYESQGDAFNVLKAFRDQLLDNPGQVTDISPIRISEDSGMGFSFKDQSDGNYFRLHLKNIYETRC